MDDKPTPTPAPAPQRQRTKHRFVSCPIYSTPLFDVVPGGIEIQCRSCRGRQKHFIAWSILDQIRASLPAERSVEYPGICIQRD